MTTSHFAALAAALMFSMAAVSVRAAATDSPAALPTAPAAPLRAAQNDHNPNQVICKREDEIGTRLGGYKACHTRAEWDKIARNGGDVVNTLQVTADHLSPNGR